MDMGLTPPQGNGPSPYKCFFETFPNYNRQSTIYNKPSTSGSGKLGIRFRNRAALPLVSMLASGTDGGLPRFPPDSGKF